MVELLVSPLLMGVILTAVFSYFGLHIVQREVIFVDLALAQIAALGAAVGVLLGLEPHGPATYLASLAFVIAGALLFALTRAADREVPQEAVIGIAYVVAAAASVLAFSFAPEAAEKIRAMLVGNILFASSSDVWSVAAVSGLVGALHLACHRQFWLVTENGAEARRRGLRVGLWDFLFYLSLGLVVVAAVTTAGILLVFSYLIIPAVCAMLLTRGLPRRLALAWLVGVVGTGLGVYLSVKLDLPTGATMVCTFGGLLAAIALITRCLRRRGP